jgi:hypothetical protein
MRFVSIFFLLVTTFGAVCGQTRDVLAGIDHIPLAVRDLGPASDDFKRLGFSIKPGRQHASGISNRHIKFPDGSGLELITVKVASDELGAAYLKHLKAGDGPAYFSLHVRDMAKLASALVEARIDFDQEAGLTTFKDPKLGFVFISTDNRSPTDRPKHFAHPNGAFAMSEVWIACEDPTPLKALLLALGATSESATVRVPEPTEGEVFELQNGKVVIVHSRNQLLSGRPVIGVVMSVRLPTGDSLTSRYEREHFSTSKSSWLVSPNSAHGIWLKFRAQQ